MPYFTNTLSRAVKVTDILAFSATHPQLGETQTLLRADDIQGGNAYDGFISKLAQ
jgi:hypothetical protein